MKDIDKVISTLTIKQKKYLLDKLRNAVLGDIPKSISVCPCCNDTNFVKNGNYKDTQKFKCKNTSKIFSYKSKSIVSGITDLVKFEELMEFMIDRKFPTIEEIKERIGISSKTAHDWRNKIITALYKDIDLDNQVIEFDETNFRLSRKGRKGMAFGRKSGRKLVGDNKFNVKVFMSYSRSTGKLELFVSHMGKSSAQDVENYLGVKKGLVVFSDKHVSYGKYYKRKRVVNKVFKAKEHVSKTDKTVHNQTLNYYCGKLQRFLDCELKGVSTKYLQGYLNWFMFIENGKREALSVKSAVMENRVALDIFKQKEKEFQYFLKINGRNNYGKCRDRYYGKVA